MESTQLASQLNVLGVVGPWIPGDGALSSSSSRWGNQMAKRSPKSPNGQETQGSAEDETNDEDEAKDRQ